MRAINVDRRSAEQVGQAATNQRPSHSTAKLVFQSSEIT
jgi:hypothetical protein